jgi:arylsulfatase A-like enzyme
MPPGFPRDIPSGDWLHYYEAVSVLDRQIGRVLAALAEAKLAGPTLVVFTGDNGFLMGHKGWGAEGTQGKIVPYEGSIRVPMILWSPLVKDLTGPADLAASSLDIPPTLLELAGIHPPENWPGRDLVADPLEEKNLIDAPEAQAIRKDLETRLRRWMDRTADPARDWRPPT